MLLGLTKKIFQVFGPLNLLQFLMAFTYLIFEELLDFELRQTLPLREGPPALGGPPDISASLRFLLLVTMGEELSK